MKNNKGLTLIALVITIIVLLILAGVSIKMLAGDNGILNRATTVEVEFNKSEVLEELNVCVTEKYLDAYKKASKDGKVELEKFYDAEKVILYLKGYSGGENGDDTTTQDVPQIITELVDGAPDYYYIDISKLGRSISDYGKGANKASGSDYFYIKKEDNGEYSVNYKNLKSEDERIGVLQIAQNI